MGHIGEKNVFGLCHLIHRIQRFLHEFHAGKLLLLRIINILKAKYNRILLQRFIIQHLHMNPAVLLIEHSFKVSAEIPDSLPGEFKHIVPRKRLPELLVRIIFHNLF